MPIVDNLVSEIKSEQTVLSKIITQRLKRVEENQIDFSKAALTPSHCSLVKSLTDSSTGIIMECKQSSPSKGLLTENYQPDKIAKNYENFASGISVLTEPDFFSGSLDDLKAVKSVVTLPVLCKDFIIDTSQIYQARAAGADAILLMLSVVTDEFWLQCYEITEQLAVDIITEVHNEHELARAVALPTKIIGINNRDLHTLKTDISVTKSLISKIPSDRLVISESGISSRHQLTELAPLVDGFLIGSSLMQTENLPLSLRKLIYGEVKICGLTSRLDADLAWELGASYGGMIFTPLSSRCINKNQAEAICYEQPMPMIGVFKDQSVKEVVDIANDLLLYGVQLHGNETIDYVRKLQQQLAEQCQIWKAISCSETIDEYPSIQQAIEISNNFMTQGINKILIDTPKNNGEHKLDFQEFLYDSRVMLAGGLQIESQLFHQQQPHLKAVKAGFDLCSSVEKSPGIKDPDKMKKLFSNIKPKTRKYHEQQ